MDKSKQWETLVAILSGLVIVYWWKRTDGWLVAAAVIGVFSLLVPAIAGWIHVGWTKLSLLLGKVTGAILLTMVYVLILVPLSFFARRFGKLGIRMKPGGESYFKSRGHRYSKQDLVHPW
jgi:hypothetical protein